MNCRFRRSLWALGVAAIAVALAMIVETARADVVASADFYLAYGADGSGTNVWTTNETSAVNSSTTQGDFIFSPAPTGSSFSGTGPTFYNAVLENGVAGNRCGWLGVGSNFLVPVTAQYTGAAPVNASSTPNYRLELEITSIGVWAADATGAGSQADRWMAWSETTAGHEADQEWTQVATNNNFGTVSGFQQVAWDPDDYSATLANINDSFTRTFGIRFATHGTDYRYGDGIEISGRVNLVYDAPAVPEPTSIIMLASGVVGVLAYAWRSRK